MAGPPRPSSGGKPLSCSAPGGLSPLIQQRHVTPTGAQLAHMWCTHLFTALRSRNVRRLALPPAAAAVISAVLILTPARADAQVIDVPAGGNLQQALNAVQPGGTIRLASGATFVGSFKLPAKGGSAYILITTN